MEDFDTGEANKELTSLYKRIKELESENEKIKEVIRVNELEEELEDINTLSIEEKICMDGIRYIGSLVESQDFDQNDIKNFDTLYKTLRTIRGQANNSSKKVKPMNVKDLLKIVGSDK